MQNDDLLKLNPETQYVSVDDPSPTVSVLWDRAAQEAVIETTAGPTISARAYGLVHTAIYDAWANYDRRAEPVHFNDDPRQGGGQPTAADLDVAMGLAADAVLRELFPEQTAIFDAALADMGVTRPADAPSEGSPADVGLAAAEAVMRAHRLDGANQLDDYDPQTNYAPVNPHPGEIKDITRWTPESIPIDPEDDDPEQSFLTPQWADIKTFGMESADAHRPPAPEPFFMPGVKGDLDMDEGTVTLADGVPREVTRDLIGDVINPAFIEQAEAIVETSATLTDRQKLIAEFWEDGPGTSFPPGTFMTFGQFVSARDDNTRAEDAQLFMALGNAVADAGAASWDAKVHYDYARPVRVIRDLGELGLIGEPGTDELTGETGHVIEAWAGPDAGVATVLAENFITYQLPGFEPSPAFAEYTSGHSAFSSAGAEILRLFTGSDAFGGSVTFEPGESRFEPGKTPTDDVTLAWDTFTDAADESGISRIYGNIHFEDGDLNGRQLGRDVARDVWNEAQKLINGGLGPADPPGDVPDFVTDIAGLYQAGLGRFPDRGGMNFWIDEIQGDGDRLPGIADSFLKSAEYANNFTARGSLDDQGFMTQLFENIDHEAPADELIEPWLARLDSGESRADVLAAFARSEHVDEAIGYLTAMHQVDEGEWWFA